MDNQKDTESEVSEPDLPRRLRGKAWVQACLAALGTSNLSVLHDKLNVVNSSGLWGKYQSGKRNPMPSTVTVVDQKLPGTAEVWLSPIWAVLKDDAVACGGHVHMLLERFTKTEPWMLLHHKALSTMTVPEKCQALIEIVVPVEYLKSPDLDEEFEKELDPDFMNRPISYSNFFEILDSQENVITKTYTEVKARRKLFDETLPEVFKVYYERLGKAYKPPADKSKSRDDLLNNDYICGIAALVCLCNSSKERRLAGAPAYLKQGIFGAIKDRYGAEVADYFMSNV